MIYLISIIGPEGSYINDKKLLAQVIIQNMCTRLLLFAIVTLCKAVKNLFAICKTTDVPILFIIFF